MLSPFHQLLLTKEKILLNHFPELVYTVFRPQLLAFNEKKSAFRTFAIVQRPLQYSEMQ